MSSNSFHCRNSYRRILNKQNEMNSELITPDGSLSGVASVREEKMKTIIAARIFAGALAVSLAACPIIPRDGHPERSNTPSERPLQTGRQDK